MLGPGLWPVLQGKPTNLSCPVIFPVGKESESPCRGGGNLITVIHSFTVAQNSRTCVYRAGLWKAAEDLVGSCAVYGKAGTVLKYLSLTQGNA